MIKVFRSVTHLFGCVVIRDVIPPYMYPVSTGNMDECMGCGWRPRTNVKDVRRRWGYHVVQHFGYYVCVCGSLFHSKDTLVRHRKQTCRLKSVLGKKWVGFNIFVERCGWEALREFLRSRFGTDLEPIQDPLPIACEGVFRAYTSESHV